jgi:hypothetical protein
MDVHFVVARADQNDHVGIKIAVRLAKWARVFQLTGAVHSLWAWPRCHSAFDGECVCRRESLYIAVSVDGCCRVREWVPPCPWMSAAVSVDECRLGFKQSIWSMSWLMNHKRNFN